MTCTPTTTTQARRGGALGDGELEALMRVVVAVGVTETRTVVRDAAATLGEDLERRMRARWGDWHAELVLERLRRELAS